MGRFISSKAIGSLGTEIGHQEIIKSGVSRSSDAAPSMQFKCRIVCQPTLLEFILKQARLLTDFLPLPGLKTPGVRGTFCNLRFYAKL